VLKVGVAENEDPGSVLNLNAELREINNDIHFAQVSQFRIYSQEYLTDGHDNDSNDGADEPDEAVKLQQLVPANGPLPFAIQTDDRKWLDQGPEGLKPPASPIVIAELNLKYKLLYTLFREIPVGGEDGRNKHPVTPTFIRNTSVHQGILDVPGDPQFWTACVTWAYEDGDVKSEAGLPKCSKSVLFGDNDPDNEGLEPGFSAVREGHAARSGDAPKRYGDRLMIWCEAIRERAPNDYEGRVLFTVTHELAHLFGAEHAICEEPWSSGVLLQQQECYDPDFDGLMLWQPPNGFNKCILDWIAVYKGHPKSTQFSFENIKMYRSWATD
jgi:hypothetical protein